MTMLSVNLNKIALLRNSRGSDFPSVTAFAAHSIHLGAQGITIHPRPDERHITRDDARQLSQLIAQHPNVELNIEGFPSPRFVKLVAECKPAQVTLVPDGPNQITSDHGWQATEYYEFLQMMLPPLKAASGRVAVFMDADIQQIEALKGLAVDRIELYTEEYANAFKQDKYTETLARYKQAAQTAQSLGFGVNAGHDLNLANLSEFLSIEKILEVSIGHALIVESLSVGWDNVIKNYLQICKTGH